MTAGSWNNGTSFNRGLVLSILLHLLISALMQLDRLHELGLHLPEPSMEVELVREPPPPPPPKIAEPPPPPPPPPPEPQQQQRPLAKPVTAPQLQRAAIAEKSATPKPAVPETGLSFEHKSKPAAPAGELSQSAQDFVLAQVLRMWRFDTNALRGSDVTIGMTIQIERDGTLAGPMSKNSPWNPREVIRGYDKLPDGPVKHALESMLLALRMAQPLDLPPDDGKGWPRRMVIRFRPGDL